MWVLDGAIPYGATIDFTDAGHLTSAMVSGREPPNDDHEVRFPTVVCNIPSLHNSSALASESKGGGA